MDHYDYLMDIAYELWLGDGQEKGVHNHDGSQDQAPRVTSNTKSDIDIQTFG